MIQNRFRNDPHTHTNARLAADYFHPVAIYVPTKPWPDRPFGIARGSAIVGIPESAETPDAVTV